MTRYIPIPDTVIPPPEARTVWRVEDRVIVLFHVAGQLYAIDDACPHAGASLANGKLEGRTIQCPAHGLQFDLLTGCLRTSKRFGVRAYGVETRQGKSYLVLGKPAESEAQCETHSDLNS